MADGPDHIRNGCIISYPYLWQREKAAGQTVATKNRETVVGMRFVHEGRDVIYLFPITSTRPREGQLAYELPETEVRRIARGDVARLWIVYDELNADTVHGSRNVDPTVPAKNHLSKAVRQDFLRVVKAHARGIRTVRRGALMGPSGRTSL